MNKHLYVQTILITGASSGVGFECAKKFTVNNNCNLLLTGREQAKLVRAVAELQRLNLFATIKGIPCDHSDAEAISTLIDTLIDDCMIPDVIIANVGINPLHQCGPRHVHSTSLGQFNQVLQVNLSNTFYLLARLLPFMKRKEQAMVILIGSKAYQYGVPGQVAYNVAKAGLIGLKNTIVSEYGRHNIACHIINLGLIENHRTAQLRKKLAQGLILGNENIQFSSEADVATKIVSFVSASALADNGLEVNL